jgi:hypothetical protein
VWNKTIHTYLSSSRAVVNRVNTKRPHACTPKRDRWKRPWRCSVTFASLMKPRSGQRSMREHGVTTKVYRCVPFAVPVFCSMPPRTYLYSGRHLVTWHLGCGRIIFLFCLELDVEDHQTAADSLAVEVCSFKMIR